MYGNHFKFAELVHTNTGLDNSVASDSHLGNLATLWNTLNFLREEFGKPILINSAYRTPAVNKPTIAEIADQIILIRTCFLEVSIFL